MSAVVWMAAAWAGPVVVARRPLDEGVPIALADLEVLAEPAPPLAPADALADRADAVGRVPRERILAGEVVREARLISSDRPVRMTDAVPAGMRLIQLPVADPTSVHPGTYIDVLGPACTWLQAVFVFGTPTGWMKHDGPGADPGAIVVLVTPEQAELVAWAVPSGLQVSIRRDDDVSWHEAPACRCGARQVSRFCTP